MINILDLNKLSLNKRLKLRSREGKLFITYDIYIENHGIQNTLLQLIKQSMFINIYKNPLMFFCCQKLGINKVFRGGADLSLTLMQLYHYVIISSTLKKLSIGRDYCC